MRIIQLINAYGAIHGGAEKLAFDIHSELIRRGEDAHLIAVTSAAAGSEIGATSLGLDRPRDPRNLVAISRTLDRLAGPGTILHAHMFPTILWAATLRRTGLAKIPLTMTEHNTTNKRRDSRMGAMIDRWIYGSMDRIAAISEGTAAALENDYPWLKVPVDMIPNGVTLRPETEVARRGDHGGPARLVTVGRLRHQKNIDTLLDALNGIRDRDWTLRIVGDGPKRAELEARMQRLDLGAKVEFIGQTEHPSVYLDWADIYLMPSRWEGFGLAAVEAMDAGLPCIVSDVPGLREVTGSQAAELVNPSDPDSIGQAIIRLIENPGLRARRGAAARQQSKQFSREVMVDRYLAFWGMLGHGRAD